MRIFRTRSIVVEAAQVTGTNWAELDQFCGADRVRRQPARPGGGVIAQVWSTDHRCWLDLRVGDWIERGAHGSLIPVRPEFAPTRYQTVGA